jgi:streptogramin lyase
MLRAILGLALFFVLAAPAHAEVIQDFQTASATNGIAFGPDGNLWVAEQFNGSVVRMSPGGSVLNRYPVGAEPIGVAADPSGRVWVSVNGANKLVWFDATAPVPTAHDKATGGGCPPVAMEAGGNGRMYYSMPDCGQIGSVPADGSGGPAVAGGFGSVFDLAAAAGKLFAPDFDGDTVRRVNMNANGTLTSETQVAVTGQPDGVAVDTNGTVWVTQYDLGRVARYPASQNGGAAQSLTPSGAALGQPFGIVAAADGRVYVSGQTTHNIARIAADGTFRFFDVADGEPWQIVNGPDGDLYFTDQFTTRVRRFLQTAPRASTGAAAGTSASTALVTATVDSRGATTAVAFDYGTTTAYGATATVSTPAALAAASVSTTLTGLTPGTTYHVRVRATNEDGAATGADTTFVTATGDADGDGAAPPLDCNDANAAIHPGAVDTPGDKIDQDCDGKDAAFPVLAARANFSWGFAGSRTALTKVTVTDLQGGETIKVTCKSRKKGCKFSSKTYKNLKKPKKGTKSLTSLFGRKRLLKTGAKIEVRITKPGAIGSSATATIGKRKRDPKIARKRINP